MPAPPPIQPVTQGHDPYAFITDTKKQAKKPLIPGGNSKISRIIIAGVGVVVLIMLALIAYSFINSGSSAQRQDFQTLVQQQAELIRISEIGVSKAKQADAKNLAVTAKYSLSSQQPQITKLAQQAGAKTDAKTLALGKEPATDAQLTSAEQTNQFDAVFIETFKSKLQKYQQLLQKIYDSSGKKSTKDILSKDYRALKDLTGN